MIVKSIPFDSAAKLIQGAFAVRHDNSGDFVAYTELEKAALIVVLTNYVDKEYSFPKELNHTVDIIEYSSAKKGADHFLQMKSADGKLHNFQIAEPIKLVP
jgi:hypothetical protein